MCTYFPPVCGLCFHSIDSFFWRADNLKFHGNLAYQFFWVMDHTFGVICLKLSPNPRSCRFSLMFSSRILIILHFTLRYKFHFKLIFVKGERFLSKFFLHKDVQLFQPPLVKTIFSSRSFYATKAYMNICFPFSNISGSI